jgi:hypothetical protein
MAIATGVAVCGIATLCVTVSLLPVDDVERIICLLLLALGYILMPCLAALLAVRAVSSTVHASSDHMPQLGPFLTRVLYFASSDLLAAFDACTTVFTAVEKAADRQAGGGDDDVAEYHACRRRRSSSSSSRAPQNATPLALSSVPATPQCAVCLDDVLPGTTARLLPCSHVFHKGCADAWLLSAKKNSCPLCLRAVCPDRDENMEPVPGKPSPTILGVASCTL